MVFYLKVNRMESYTYHNLQHWVRAIELLDIPKVYILCDKDELEKNIVSKVCFNKIKPEFIKSCNTSARLDYIVSNIADEKWTNAAYAHLTTFWHAYENHFEQFWNIDADDTFLCLSPERICELLEKVQLYADENRINAFSLDMWRTREPNHWTFGITYTDNKVDWLKYMEQSCGNYKLEEYTHREKNVDSYFSVLKNITDLKIETYYFENLRFIHYSNDFFRRSIVSGMFHWKEGKLCFPILYYCFGMETLGLLPIAKDIIKLDINITDQESFHFMAINSMDKHLIDEYTMWDYHTQNS